jgi:leucyl/phenylalanyl-tRNA--protein transferase
MFHRVTDASKVALAALVRHLEVSSAGEPWLVDVQWRTDHLGSLGVREVSRTAYLGLLAARTRGSHRWPEPSGTRADPSGAGGPPRGSLDES